MPLTSSTWAAPRSGSPAARPASRWNSATSSPMESDGSAAPTASWACPVLDSRLVDSAERTHGPYVSQYASSSLTQRGRLVAPPSQRLTFGSEAVATPNCVRRTWAHVSMSCPACLRVRRSRTRSALPQATSAFGCPDTRIVSHTHIQEVYASDGYYTYVAYTAVPDRGVFELPPRLHTPGGYTSARAPPKSTPSTTGSPASTQSHLNM
jgi:hypothetical protein